MSWGLPTDLLAAALFRLPTRIADPAGRLVQRLTVGELSHWGLTVPDVGIFTRLHEGTAPTIVGRDVIAAIRAGDFEIVPGVCAVNAGGVRLTDGTTLRPDALIAATGYTTGLEPLVGHLGVLDEAGLPFQYRGIPVRPGLRFLGYAPCMGVIGRDARRVARHLYSELTAAEPAGDFAEVSRPPEHRLPPAGAAQAWGKRRPATGESASSSFTATYCSTTAAAPLGRPWSTPSRSHPPMVFANEATAEIRP